MTSILLKPKIETVCFCWGSGVGGALGLFRKSELKPVLVVINQHKSLSALSVSTGYHTSTITSLDGVCYSWGSGKSCLGRKATSLKNQHEIHKVQLQNPVSKVAHGKDHFVMLTNDTMFVCGSASDGKLGLGKKLTGEVTVPKRVSCVKDKIIDVACCQSSTTILLEDRRLVTIGSLMGIGRSSRQKRTSLCTPISFPFKTEIDSISCGLNHCAAVSTSGDCFTWGLSENGRLGHGGTESDDIILQPERVEYFFQNNISISKVVCGSAHSCALTKGGTNLFCFGWNNYYQCGLGEDEPSNILSPREVELNGNIVSDVSCGFAHTAIITDEGHLFTWGFNEEGQLGLGHERNVGSPTLLDFGEKEEASYVLSVACGHTHTISINCIDPSLIQKKIDDYNKMIQSCSILGRFGRFCLLKTRLVKYKKEDSTDNNEIVSADDEVDSIHSLSETTSSDNSFSTYEPSDDEESGEIEEILEPPGDEDFSSEKIIQERLHMQNEDGKSRALTLWIQQYNRQLIRKKTSIANEVIRQIEEKKMRQEDLLSRIIHDSVNDTISSQCEEREHNNISARNNRTRQLIKREADRLSNARLNKLGKTNIVGSTKSKKQRRPSAPSSFRRKPIEDESTVNTQVITKNLSHQRRNMKLIQRREERLSRLKKEQDEQELKENIDSCNVKEKQISPNPAAIESLLRYNMEKMREKSKHETVRLLEELNSNHCSIIDTNQNNTSNQFMSVREWSDTLFFKHESTFHYKH